MKKRFILGAFSLCLMAVSCVEKEPVQLPEAEGLYTIDATIDADTKSAVTDAGAFTWAAGDAISVFTTANQFVTFTLDPADAGKKTGKFMADLASGVMPYGCAVYPAGNHKVKSETELSVNMPATYGSLETAYARNTNAIMAAFVQQDGKLAFYHAGGVLRFEVAGVPAGASKFVFKTAEVITGDFNLEGINEMAPVINNKTGNTGNEVALLFKAFETAKDEIFYIPLPAGTYAGFTVEIQKADGTVLASMTSSKSQTLSRKSLALIPKLAVGGDKIGAAAISVPEEPIKEDYTAHSFDIPVTSVMEFVAEKDNAADDWYTLAVADGKVTVTLTENTDTEKTVARRASFTLKAKNDETVTCPVTIRQAYNPTTRYTFELGDGSANTWVGKKESGDNVDPVVADNILKCMRKSYVQKTLKAKGTYSIKIKDMTGSEKKAVPYFVMYLNTGGYDNEFWYKVKQESFYNTWTVSKGSSFEDNNYPGSGALSKQTILDTPISLRFEKYGENAKIKVSYIIGDTTIKQYIADGVSDSRLVAINYGTEIYCKVGNANQWSGDTYYEYWEYTMPEEDINWGE